MIHIENKKDAIIVTTDYILNDTEINRIANEKLNTYDFSVKRRRQYDNEMNLEACFYTIKKNISNIDDAKVSLNDGRILSLTDFTKENATYLINELENYKDEFSKELRNSLSETFGEKWSVVTKKIDDIKCEPKMPFHRLYDFHTNIALNDILYPNVDEE